MIYEMDAKKSSDSAAASLSAPRITLTPIQTPGRTEMTRELLLTFTQKVKWFVKFLFLHFPKLPSTSSLLPLLLSLLSASLLIPPAPPCMR